MAAGLGRDEAAYLRQQERHAEGAIRRYLGQLQEDATECVRERPWWTVAACLGLGLLAGLVLGRETCSKPASVKEEREPKPLEPPKATTGQRFLAETLGHLRSAIQQGVVGALVARFVSARSRGDR